MCVCVWEGIKHLRIFISNRYYIEGILKHMFNLKFPNLNLDNFFGLSDLT